MYIGDSKIKCKLKALSAKRKLMHAKTILCQFIFHPYKQSQIINCLIKARNTAFIDLLQKR